MKKYLIGIFLVLALVVVPLASQAVTLGELQTKITALMAQIAILQPASTGISIDSISGPTSLNVNQTGTWSLKVTAPTSRRASLSYSVDWGDVVRVQEPKSFSPKPTFSHVYTQAGTYTVNFGVYGSGLTPVFSRLTVVVGSFNDNTGVLVHQNPKFPAPSLSVAYNANNPNYPYLVGTFNVSASNNTDKPIYLQSWEAYAQASSSLGYPLVVRAMSAEISADPSSLPGDAGGYYLVSPGQTRNFKVLPKWNTSVMLKGTYSASLVGFRYYGKPDPGFGIFAQVSSPLITNSVYIIGERGPWIKDVSFDSSKRTIVITGERLKQITSAKIGSYDFSSPIWLANWVTRTDTKVTIQESKIWPTGSVLVSLGSSLGESNKLYVTIPPVASLTQAISQPKAVSYGPPLVNIPLSVLSVHPGERVNLVGLRLTSSVTARGLSRGLSGFVLNDAKTNLSFRIHPLESPGRYLAKVNGPRDLQSNTFTIVVTPSAIPLPEINVSRSILRTQPGGRITIVGTNLTSMFDTELKKSLSNISVNAAKTQVTFNVNDRQDSGNYRFAVQNDTGISNTVNITIDPVTAPVASPQTDPYHPADLNHDYVIDQGEANAHTSAWQNGTVPMSEAIRARYLYCFGGAYKYELGAVGNFAPLSTATNICNP